MPEVEDGRLGFAYLNEFLRPGRFMGEFSGYIWHEALNFAQDKTYQKHLKNFDHDSTFANMEGLSLPYSFGGVFQKKELLAWWQWRINEKGYRSANINLENFRKTKKLSGYYFSVVQGLYVTKRTKLTENVFLLPLADIPNFEGKERFASETSYPVKGSPIIRYKKRSVLVASVSAIVDGELPKNGTDLQSEIYTCRTLLNCLADTAAYTDKIEFISDESSPFGVLSGSKSWQDHKTSLNPNTSKRHKEFCDAVAFRRLYASGEGEVPHNVANAIQLLTEAKF